MKTPWISHGNRATPSLQVLCTFTVIDIHCHAYSVYVLSDQCSVRMESLHHFAVSRWGQQATQAQHIHPLIGSASGLCSQTPCSLYMDVVLPWITGIPPFVHGSFI